MEKPYREGFIRKIISKLGLKIIDVYIIKKFLGTFFFAIIIIIGIAVIFDISEKIDDFIEKAAPLKAIIFDYYMNFIPYFTVLFSSLFTFISVIFFTSKMASDTEIIAILASGMSFRRLLLPYMIAAFLLSTFAFLMSNYVIPPSNKIKLAFEDKYIHDKPVDYNAKNIHKQIEPGVFIYMESYQNVSNMGYKFSMEKFDKGQLVSKLFSEYIQWDSTINKWVVHDYYIRNMNGQKEKLTKGVVLDTSLSMHPSDFKRRNDFIETMSIGELGVFIKEQKQEGTNNIETMVIERDKRIAFPFSSFILTLIGVCLSTRKVRGGIGVHIGVGMLLSFSYILFMQFSSQFAISGTFSPALAAWTPNIIFSVVAFFLYRMAPK
jgi:lipopolysaccharide export system permease protein